MHWTVVFGFQDFLLSLGLVLKIKWLFLKYEPLQGAVVISISQSDNRTLYYEKRNQKIVLKKV